MKNYLCLFLLLTITLQVFAQNKLPVIKATSKKVSINDGGIFSKNSWNLSPQARPDVYTADRTRKTKWVTFYTDLDSIRIKVKPGSSYDFVIVLNGKDSCYTRVNSGIPPGYGMIGSANLPDTIPFKLTAFNAIAIKVLINKKDTLTVHFDASSSGIHLLKDVMTRYKTSKINSLQIGNSEINNPKVSIAPAASQEMDGRLGFEVFEGKQVELNFDKNIMVITSRLNNTKGYVKANLIFNLGFPCLSGSVNVNGKNYNGLFTLDNGSSTAMVLDSGWAAKANVTAFKLLRSSAVTDGSGNKYVTKIVELPAFTFKGFRLTNVPATVFASHTPFGPEVNFFGNDLMKRFNMILDFKNDKIYIQENHLLKVPYKDSVGG